MYTLQGGLNIEGAHVLNELRKAEECLHLGRHGIQKRCGKHVHALHVCEAKLVGHFSVCSTINYCGVKYDV
jgi:hypothetical protein